MARELSQAFDPGLPFPASRGRCGLPALPPPDWSEQLPTLVGDRVVLRDLAPADAPALVASLSTTEVQRFIAAPPDTVEAFQNFIVWAHAERSRARYACFGVVPHGASGPVGVFQLRQVEGSFVTAEWGFALSSAYWGSGTFGDAARLVVDFAVETLGVRRLEARSAVGNGRGNGALRKLGAVQEGVLRGAFRKGDRVLDAALWAILADEWRYTRALWRPTTLH